MDVRQALQHVAMKASVRDGAQTQLDAAVQTALSLSGGDADTRLALAKLTGVVLGSENIGDDYATCRVVKAAEERRYTLGVAYPAMKPDVNVAADGHIDFVSPEVLEKTAWEWMSKHRDIGLFHRTGTEGHATVVESYIYRGPDWVTESPVNKETCVIKAGDWLMGTVWDEHGWALVKAGLVNGWSPEGGARRVKPDASRLSQLRS